MTDLENISSIFNIFYNMYLNGSRFEYLIDLYIKKNLHFIFGETIPYQIIDDNLNSTLPGYIYKELKFNNKLFGRIYIYFDENNKFELDALNLFISYLSLFHYNNSCSRPTDIIKCNLFMAVLNMMSEGIIIMNESLNIVFLNKVGNIILDKIHDHENYINRHIYDIFSQLEDHVKEFEIYKNKRINYKINRNNTDFNIMLTMNTIIHNNISYNMMSLCPQLCDIKTCDNIGFLSHELRNPLQTISFASELIKIKKEEKYLSIIDKSVCDMIKIINDVLDIDRIDSNQVQLSISDVQIDDILNDIDFSVPKSKCILFEIRKHDLPARMYTDPTRLKQILVNIIDNSIKYSKPGRVNNIILKVMHNVNTNSVDFYISDTGTGIKEEDISELMELKPSISLNKNNSNGIGLYLCNKLAILLGGNIKINSDYMNFTEIIFSHPLNLTYNDNIIEKKVEKFRIFNKILIVDTDKILLNLFKDILMNLRYKYNISDNLLIDLCNNANMVCDMVKLNNYDIIFMDLYMYDINGTTIAKLLRKQIYNNKIIGMTINAGDIFCNDSLTTSLNESNMTEEKVKIIQLYDDIILKPFNENDILERIKY